MTNKKLNKSFWIFVGFALLVLGVFEIKSLWGILFLLSGGYLIYQNWRD